MLVTQAEAKEKERLAEWQTDNSQERRGTQSLQAEDELVLSMSPRLR
jgi:hypothetical protein